MGDEEIQPVDEQVVPDALAADAETEEAFQPKHGTYVQYIYPPNRRGLTSGDLANLGLTEREDIWWDAKNGWQILLDELDFPEDLAAEVFTHENGFKIVEL